MAEQRQWTPEELQGLAALGLSITPHSDPSHGWGYTWQNRDWVGPFTTPDAAIHAAFTEALLALQFKSNYSWVLFAQPGERWQFAGEGEGWVHISERMQASEPMQLHSQKRFGIDAENTDARAHEDFANDE